MRRPIRKESNVLPVRTSSSNGLGLAENLFAHSLNPSNPGGGNNFHRDRLDSLSAFKKFDKINTGGNDLKDYMSAGGGSGHF